MPHVAADPTSTQPRRSGLAFWWTMFVGGLLVILGLLIGAGGAWLIALGGSWYYLPTGIALLVAGGLLLSGNVAGIWLYVLTWIATLAWAYWEVGMDSWGLMPRGAGADGHPCFRAVGPARLWPPTHEAAW
ncbi:hypothetical protein MesoLj113c_44410 [Mesorhizobium sp. 113-3-9]|uniref:hypothetical protein n=1 Tax=Mesorhizobium sp. 113-3-9 TaxID=2744517 RepID=UPI0019289DC1|nr:hypothetical protein [Mesorhizobium sp. 113-3-9]BCG88331.1 hypothetical protein MesoLj113c_44410 [Mesorhizobium sp. 113-3-9]